MEDKSIEPPSPNKHKKCPYDRPFFGLHPDHMMNRLSLDIRHASDTHRAPRQREARQHRRRQRARRQRAPSAGRLPSEGAPALQTHHTRAANVPSSALACLVLACRKMVWRTLKTMVADWNWVCYSRFSPRLPQRRRRRPTDTPHEGC